MKELIANGYGIAVNVSLAILAVLCVGLAVRWLIQKSWLVASGVLIDICGRNFNWLVFAFAVVGACLYGGAKNGAGQEALNGLGLNGSLLGTNAQHGRSDSDFTADSPEDNLSFISFSMSSNIASFGLSWKTNFSPARAWLELYEKLHSLTNPWLPRLVRELPAHATNDAFTVTLTNDVPPAAFYSVRMDSLHVDFPGVEMTESADGRRVYTSFGPKSFAVAVNRPQRPDGFPPFDPAFAVNPFVYVDGLTYEPDTSTLRADGYGVYELPDGSVLAAFADPKVSFGSPHDYVGATLSYDSGSYAKSSPYPLSTPSLQKGWSRGTTPGTGCSCVPSVDFGGGLVVQGSSGTALRANSTGLPPGMWTDYEYADGGVWVTLYNHTNVVWRKWCEHRRYADNGGTSDELGGPQDEDTCDCGDEDALEGSLAGSVRFRIPLGSANAGEVSGFLYFNRNAPFDVTPSAFELLCRGDAYVTDNYGPDGTRTVICRARHGRKIVVRGNDDGDGVDIEVRDTASDDLLHTWTVTRDGSTIRIVQISVLDNTMQDKSYTYDDGEWTETDNISDLSDQRIVQDRLNGDGTLREERVVTCAEKVAIHVITESRRFGTGTNAVLRETERRELGVDETWKVARASYWEDTAHPRRHGSLRLEQGDDRAWNYRAYDDEGRLVFRLDQRDGSEVPADALDYSITNLPPVSAAFATTYDYSPLAGDEGRSNDWKKVRTESKYVVENGVAILIGRTWNTYGRGTSDGYPTIVQTKERAASQTAQRGDAGNAISVSAVFDDESEAVPYVLRGEPASVTDENGVTTRYERTGVRGVLRTVERKFFNGNERKTRRVTEQDWNYGNLLYEAEAITADGTEFGWARHAYDEKNRLRFTQYDDGSWETNAYSCCRLLWSIDRTGAKRLRSAHTGTDRVYYADEDVYIAALPDDGFLRPDDWNGANLKDKFRIVQHYLDGLGRETNRWVRSHYTQGIAESPSFQQTKSAHAITRTEYPQGVSDVKVTIGPTGCETSERRVATAFNERVETEERDPNSATSSVVCVVDQARGGARVERRSFADGRWRETSEWNEYGADGCRRRIVRKCSSELSSVTNRFERYDFLGRVIRQIAPSSDEVLAYVGAGNLVVSRQDLCSDVVTTNLYDEAGELVGSVSGGVVRRSDTTYSLRDGDLWKIESGVESSGAVTKGCRAVMTRLTGLSDSLRNEIVCEEGGVMTERTASSFDADTKVLETVNWSLAAGTTVSRSMFGVEIEKAGRDGLFRFFHDPWERTYSIHRGNPDGTGMKRLRAFDVDVAGNVTGDYEMHGDYPEYALVSYIGYDCRGNRIATTNAAGESVAFSYDADGQMTAMSGDAYPLRYGHDTDGNRTSLETTRNGGDFDSTGWTFDPLTGLCRSKAYADASTVAYAHAADGLPMRTTYPGGHWIENAYDGNRVLSGVTSDDDTCCAWFANDVFGRRTAASNVVCRYAYSYGQRDVVTNETAEVDGLCMTICRQADAIGRMTSLSVSGSGDLAVLYATNGMIQTVATPDAVAEYLYNEFSADVGYRLALTNGVSFVRSLTRSPHLHGEILAVRNVVGQETNSYAYTYDAAKRPISRNADTFAYNRRGEVTNEVVAGVIRTHAYDFIGNEQPANCLNQYLGLAYSPNGELVSDGIFTYAYDALSRLTAAYSNGTLVVSNRYDHLGRRVVKIAADGTHTFLYDGWRPLVETVVRPDSTTDRIDYVWGKDISGTIDGAAGIGGLLYVKVNGAVFVPFYDAYGNVMGYRDAEGNAVAEYVYDVFGRTVAQNGTMADVFAMRYSTKYYDKEAGLYYYGKRHYSPTWRRWLTRDPIEERGGLNLYVFCRNNALLFLDKDGQAFFAVRRLEDNPVNNFLYKMTGSGLANDFVRKHNMELVHEHLFFQDGKLPSDIGWGDDDANPGNGTYMHDGGFLADVYTQRDGGYDDCVMREAVARVKPTRYNAYSLGFSAKYNCQDYADELRTMYWQLKDDPEVRCKCKPR